MYVLCDLDIFVDMIDNLHVDTQLCTHLKGFSDGFLFFQKFELLHEAVVETGLCDQFRDLILNVLL